jgi:hypothetical protein
VFVPVLPLEDSSEAESSASGAMIEIAIGGRASGFAVGLTAPRCGR